MWGGGGVVRGGRASGRAGVRGRQLTVVAALSTHAGAHACWSAHARTHAPTHTHLQQKVHGGGGDAAGRLRRRRQRHRVKPGWPAAHLAGEAVPQQVGAPAGGLHKPQQPVERSLIALRVRVASGGGRVPGRHGGWGVRAGVGAHLLQRGTQSDGGGSGARLGGCAGGPALSGASAGWRGGTIYRVPCE